MNRRAILRCLFAIGFERILRRRYRDRLVLLMYHGFTANGSPRGLENFEGNHLHVDRFREQMRYLKRSHSVIPIEEAIASLANDRPLPPRPVVLTMDDGYESNFALALPILREHAMPASVFVTTGFVERGEPLWPDRIEWALGTAPAGLEAAEIGRQTVTIDLRSERGRQDALKMLLARLKSMDQKDRDAAVIDLENRLGRHLAREQSPPPIYRPLSWQQIREMLACGLITLGNHTDSHFILSKCGSDQQRHEIETAHRTIAERTGVRCRIFCYPNGQPEDFDATTKQCLQALGYTAAITTVPGFNVPGVDLFELRRVAINDRATLDDFRLALHGGLRGFVTDLRRPSPIGLS